MGHTKEPRVGWEIPAMGTITNSPSMQPQPNQITIKAETFNLVLKALENAQDGNPCPLFLEALNALRGELERK